ncbi:MAG: hypothetical protein H0U87_04950 [Acidobacteria bacterium]|jgi:hypothetical protein|nr:hypothetical protein [Acidobacteriota bacterium]
MQLSRPAYLLFALNLLDALFTLFWVHNSYATESNQLMAGLLDIGYAPFLTVKIGIGALAALVVSRWGNLPVARYGLRFALTIYVGIMGVHLLTGLSAFGFLSDASLAAFTDWSNGLFAFFI